MPNSAPKAQAPLAGFRIAESLPYGKAFPAGAPHTPAFIVWAFSSAAWHPIAMFPTYAQAMFTFRAYEQDGTPVRVTAIGGEANDE